MNRISQIIFFIIIIFSNTLCSQSKKIKGKISASFEIPEGVHVNNKTKGFFTVSDNNGNFSINAEVNDTIKLTAINAMDCQLIINKNDFELGQIFPELKENVVHLHEVTLTGYQKMDLVKMGVISKNVKEYTPAERRLNFAKSGINGVVNRINGTLKYRIKELEHEKRNALIEKIHMNFENTYFINELKIPTVYINGFIEYCMNDQTFIDILEENLFLRVKFLFIDKSVEHLKIIKN